MKFTALPSIAVAFLFSSCTAYQYVTMDSDLHKTPVREFEFQNDTLVVKYTFLEKNGVMNVQVHNRTGNVPLIVDWESSAIIINGERHPYLKSQTIQAVSTSPSTFSKDSFNLTRHNIIGTLSKSETSSLIPPNSFLNASTDQIRNDFFSFGAWQQIQAL